MREEKRRIPVWVWGTVVVASVIILWSLSWFLIDKFVVSSNSSLSTNEAARGVFGDKFGAVNALFSGLAFTGIIWTLILQRSEISSQRKDIDRQNKTLEQQQFESALFQLLGLHTSIVEKLDIKASKGRDAFDYFIRLLKGSAPELVVFHALRRFSSAELYELRTSKTIPQSVLPLLEETEKDAIKEDINNGFVYVMRSETGDISYHASIVNSAYARALEKSRYALSHYFRNLYHIFKFIASAEISRSDKIKYANIVRAQLSDDELVAIFYNCLARIEGVELGFPKMVNFAVDFDLFQNLNKFSLLHEKHYLVYADRIPSAGKR